MASSGQHSIRLFFQALLVTPLIGIYLVHVMAPELQKLIVSVLLLLSMGVIHHTERGTVHRDRDRYYLELR